MLMSVFWQYWICCFAWFFHFSTSEIAGSVSEKQTSFSCPVKNRPLCSACCSSLPFSGCMHARDLKAFIPAGNQPELFLCQFSPTPQFRQALSPTKPTMKDLSSFSLSTSDIFFWLLPLCRQHAAYANTCSFIPETPPLNECNLKWGHTCTHLQRGHGKHAQTTISGFTCPLWNAVTQTWNTEIYG